MTRHAWMTGIVTFGRVGFLKPASGTWGSLAALPFAWMLHQTCGSGAVALFAVAMFLLGWWASIPYLRVTGGEDPSEIVIDEVAGQALLIAFLMPTWQGYALGFVLFRLFDILKPWPISLADRRFKHAFGVMLDDIMAAVYPLLLIWLAIRLWPPMQDWFETMQGL